MKSHPLCDLIPEMPGDQYERLRDDMRANGLLNDIVTYEGQILDGKHRFRACQALGVEPRFRAYLGDDPAGYVYSANVAHRHLTKGQLAMAAAKLKAYFAVKAAERQIAMAGAHGKNLQGNSPEGSGGANRGQARDLAAAKFGVNGTTVDEAEHIMKKGTPELVAAVERGEISVHQGVSIADMPKDRQRRVVEMPSKKTRSAAIAASEAKARGGRQQRASAPEQVPGSVLVKTLLSRLEVMTNEIERSGLAPEQFAKQFMVEFDWSEPLLVKRLAYCRQAIDAIASLAVMGERARRQAA